MRLVGGILPVHRRVGIDGHAPRAKLDHRRVLPYVHRAPPGTRRSISSANWLWRARQALSCGDGRAEPRRMSLIASSTTALYPGGMEAVGGTPKPALLLA